MKKNYNAHGSILKNKLQKTPTNRLLNDMVAVYDKWVDDLDQLDCENNGQLKQKVDLLNTYKNATDNLVLEHFKMQDKIASSIMEEFLFHLLKDIPTIKSSIVDGLLYVGSAHAYTDLSFAPKNLRDFILNPGVYVNKKNQDFTISKIVKCSFSCNGKEEHQEFTVPAVAIECKTFLPSTMLGQSIYEAQLLKQGNPYSMYIIVAEQNALSDDVNLQNIPVDEIFILRKQKRNSQKNKVSDKFPISHEVVQQLYDYVKAYLSKDLFNNQKGTERGWLINR